MSYLKLAAATAIFLAGCTVTSWYYGKQIATMQKEAAEATTKAVQEARDEERANQKRINDALAEANLRAQKNAALARALDGDVNRVRDELAAARADLSKASADAVRRYSDALGDVYGACTARYSVVAKEADQCSSDLRLMQDAWPD